MGAFGKLTLTNRGRNLQSKAQTGVELNYTRIKIGNGNLGSSSILNLNDLISVVRSLDISKLAVQTGGRAVVGTTLTNQEITTGFYFRELGVFAQDPDLGEILYCYGNAGALAEYIPPTGEDIVEKAIDIVTIVGNAQNVTAQIDNSLIFETPSGAQEKATAALESAKQYADDGLEDKADLEHQHEISEVTGLQTALNSKLESVTWTQVQDKPTTFSPSEHGHEINEVDGLSQALEDAEQNAKDYADEEFETKTDAIAHKEEFTQHEGKTVTEAHEPLFGAYREEISTVSGTGTVTLNADNSPAYRLTMAGTTTLNLSTTSSEVVSLSVFLEQGGTAHPITFSSAIKWRGGEIPDVSEPNFTYALTFITYNGGTTWLGFLAGDFDVS
ncbi:phage tail protein [Paenalkalicoccus suaedae]|uniref:Phage tail protein n=1 Tax=Paenalkalicoccus suaedae TaxID=2592382 RepID=A0A859FDG8_9BACI|nr:phage tail protein [Paenalkalicoccus suaedae]QKS70266.1 phage tail protein [Paenalkalicoccus suaedae]